MIKNVIAAYLTAFLNLVGIVLWLSAWGLGIGLGFSLFIKTLIYMETLQFISNYL
jgi:hypothetical protein